MARTRWLCLSLLLYGALRVSQVPVPVIWGGMWVPHCFAYPLGSC